MEMTATERTTGNMTGMTGLPVGNLYLYSTDYKP
jgi:hypothetical protein